MMKFTKGTNMSKAMNVLLPMPQIQFNKKAPQFHPSISAGTIAFLPWPEVFSIMLSCDMSQIA
jgi:hypothetical protein